MTEPTPTQRIDRLERALTDELRGLRQDMARAMAQMAETAAFQRTHHERLHALEQSRHRERDQWSAVWPQLVASVVGALITAATIGGLLVFYKGVPS